MYLYVYYYATLTALPQGRNMPFEAQYLAVETLAVQASGTVTSLAPRCYDKTMPLELPLPIEHYFASRGGQASSPIGEYFATDAVLWDKGEDLELRGLPKIEKWMSGNSSQYKLNTELKSIEERDGAHVVAAVVSGDFPGSPYAFSYRFTLLGDRIQELAVDPTGPVGG
jgi:hypothetical protein